ncbi:selenocysteine-specific translation elongation factor, partial [Escherichia coli 96.0428]
FPEK